MKKLINPYRICNLAQYLCVGFLTGSSIKSGRIPELVVAIVLFIACLTKDYFHEAS